MSEPARTVKPLKPLEGHLWMQRLLSAPVNALQDSLLGWQHLYVCLPLSCVDESNGRIIFLSENPSVENSISSYLVLGVHVVMPPRITYILVNNSRQLLRGAAEDLHPGSSCSMFVVVVITSLNDDHLSTACPCGRSDPFEVTHGHANLII